MNVNNVSRTAVDERKWRKRQLRQTNRTASIGHTICRSVSLNFVCTNALSGTSAHTKNRNTKHRAWVSGMRRSESARYFSTKLGIDACAIATKHSVAERIPVVIRIHFNRSVRAYSFFFFHFVQIFFNFFTPSSYSFASLVFSCPVFLCVGFFHFNISRLIWPNLQQQQNTQPRNISVGREVQEFISFHICVFLRVLRVAELKFGHNLDRYNFCATKE